MPILNWVVGVRVSALLCLESWIRSAKFPKEKDHSEVSQYRRSPWDGTAILSGNLCAVFIFPH